MWRRSQGLSVRVVGKEGGFLSKPGRQGKVYESHYSFQQKVVMRENMGFVHCSWVLSMQLALPMDIGPISSLKKEGRATVLAGDQLQPTLPCSLQAPHAKGHLPCVLFQLAQSQQVAETFCAGPRLAM